MSSLKSNRCDRDVKIRMWQKFFYSIDTFEGLVIDRGFGIPRNILYTLPQSSSPYPHQ